MLDYAICSRSESSSGFSSSGDTREFSGSGSVSVKESGADSSDDDPVLRKERSQVERILKNAVRTCVWRFASLPITVCLTLVPYSVTDYAWYVWVVWLVVLVTKLVLSIRSHLATGDDISDWIDRHEDLSGHNYEFQRARDLLLGESRSWLYCVPENVFLLIITAPYCLNWDLDFATALNAFALEDVLAPSWEESWANFPLVGKYIAAVPMPILMLTICVLAIVYRLWLLNSLIRNCRNNLLEWPSPNDYEAKACAQRFFVWQQLGAIFDVSGSLFEGQVCQAVCHDLCDPWNDAEIKNGKTNKHFPPGRGAKFKAIVVYEAAPQIWLQVSFFADAYSSLNLRVLITGLSNVAIILIKIFFEFFVNLRRIHQLWPVMNTKSYEVLQMVFVAFIAVACTVRFCGIWLCEEHVFNLTSGCCHGCDPNFMHED